MTRIRIGAGLLLACLLLALSGCGNKGPLYLPQDEEQQQKKNEPPAE